MFSIESCPIPNDALLGHYLKEGAYTDCYVTAFDTTLVFKLERLILRLFVSRPSTDIQVAELATGTVGEFSAWGVQGCFENKLLLCDFKSRTRSWLMVVPVSAASDVHTRLYFGSTVAPGKNPKTGKSSLGIVFRALLGFHKLYSVVLLHAARLQLEKRQRSDSAN